MLRCSLQQRQRPSTRANEKACAKTTCAHEATGANTQGDGGEGVHGQKCRLCVGWLLSMAEVLLTLRIIFVFLFLRAFAVCGVVVLLLALFFCVAPFRAAAVLVAVL